MRIRHAIRLYTTSQPRYMYSPHIDQPRCSSDISPFFASVSLSIITQRLFLSVSLAEVDSTPTQPPSPLRPSPTPGLVPFFVFSPSALCSWSHLFACCYVSPLVRSTSPHSPTLRVPFWKNSRKTQSCIPPSVAVPSIQKSPSPRLKPNALDILPRHGSYCSLGSLVILRGPGRPRKDGK